MTDPNATELRAMLADLGEALGKCEEETNELRAKLETAERRVKELEEELARVSVRRVTGRKPYRLEPVRLSEDYEP